MSRPARNERRVLACLLGALLACSCIATSRRIEVADIELEGFLGRRVAAFKVANPSVLVVVNNLLVAVESAGIATEFTWVPQETLPPAPPAAIEFGGATVREVIEKLLEQNPRYTYAEENGFIVLIQRPLLQDSKNPLNFVVDKIDVSSVSPHIVVNIINEKLKAAGLRRLVWGSNLVGGLEPDITLKAERRTVRWILIGMARQREADLRLGVHEDYVSVSSLGSFKARQQLDLFQPGGAFKEEGLR